MSVWQEPGAVEMAKALYASGQSARQVADALGAKYRLTITRSAIIGKSHRDGWIRNPAHVPTRGQPSHIVKRTKPPKPAPAPRPVVIAPIPPPVENALPCRVNAWAVLPGRDPLPDNPDLGRCQWPIGSTYSVTGWCGCVATKTDKGVAEPYCVDHRAIAFSPVKPKSLMRLVRAGT